MVGAFTQSKLKGFRQSPLKARESYKRLFIDYRNIGCAKLHQGFPVIDPTNRGTFDTDQQPEYDRLSRRRFLAWTATEKWQGLDNFYPTGVPTGPPSVNAENAVSTIQFLSGVPAAPLWATTASIGAGNAATYSNYKHQFAVKTFCGTADSGDYLRAKVDPSIAAPPDSYSDWYNWVWNNIGSFIGGYGIGVDSISNESAIQSVINLVATTVAGMDITTVPWGSWYSARFAEVGSPTYPGGGAALQDYVLDGMDFSAYTGALGPASYVAPAFAQSYWLWDATGDQVFGYKMQFRTNANYILITALIKADGTYTQYQLVQDYTQGVYTIPVTVPMPTADVPDPPEGQRLYNGRVTFAVFEKTWLGWLYEHGLSITAFSRLAGSGTPYSADGTTSTNPTADITDVTADA